MYHFTGIQKFSYEANHHHCFSCYLFLYRFRRYEAQNGQFMITEMPTHKLSSARLKWSVKNYILATRSTSCAKLSKRVVRFNQRLAMDVKT